MAQRGAPSKLTDEVADLVVERVRALWAPWESIARAAKVTRPTLDHWRKQGNAARAKQAMGLRLTKTEARYADFLCRVEAAEEEAHQRYVALAAKVAQGGLEIGRTVVKVDGKGNVIETITQSSLTLPSERMIQWILTRRRPDLYADRVEVTGAGGGPIEMTTEERATALGEALRAYQQGVEDGRSVPPLQREAIEASATEVTTNGAGE